MGWEAFAVETSPVFERGPLLWVDLFVEAPSS